MYAVIWHTERYTDPNCTLVEATTPLKAEQSVKKRCQSKKEYGEFYVDAIVSGDNLKVEYDGWG